MTPEKQPKPVNYAAKTALGACDFRQKAACPKASDFVIYIGTGTEPSSPSITSRAAL